jgi:hypothetical protein
MEMATTKRILILAAALATFAEVIVPAIASHVDQFKAIGGLSVYLGVVPAEIVRGHSPEHPEGVMHGGAPSGKKDSHVVVAVFDAGTGKRIADSEVVARVAETGLTREKKKLEAMKIADTVTYGNYFRMTAKGPYRISAEIRTAGATRPLTVDFEYKHH